jgi:hypothetical protein
MKNVVHQLATCMECDWVNSDYKNGAAKKAAKRHNRQTGHRVVGETAIAWSYGEKDPLSKS